MGSVLLRTQDPGADSDADRNPGFLLSQENALKADRADAAQPPRIERSEFIRDRCLHQPLPKFRYRASWQPRRRRRGHRVGDHLTFPCLVTDSPAHRLDPRRRVHIGESLDKQRDQFAIHLIDARADVRHGGTIGAGDANVHAA